MGDKNKSRPKKYGIIKGKKAEAYNAQAQLPS